MLFGRLKLLINVFTSHSQSFIIFHTFHAAINNIKYLEHKKSFITELIWAWNDSKIRFQFNSWFELRFQILSEKTSFHADYFRYFHCPQTKPDSVDQ